MSDKLLEPKQNSRTYGLAYGLWFLTAILSLLVFLSGRQMIVRTYTRFFPWEAWKYELGAGSLSLVNIFISLPLAMVMIAIIIGGFEFQYHNIGKPRAWRLLARILAIELGILLLAFFI